MRQRGFTLLEVMVATSIMAIGIVGALELFTGSLRLAGDAGRQSGAAILARALVDEELWRDEIEENERTGSEGLYSFRVVTHPIERGLVGRDEENRPQLKEAADEMGLWLVQAEVSWEGPTGPKTIVFETARLGVLPE